MSDLPYNPDSGWNEIPFSNEMIEDMVARGEATPLWGEGSERAFGAIQADIMIDSLLVALGWRGEDHRVFLDALAAGHTCADASRGCGRIPEWGYRRLAELRRWATEDIDSL